MKAHNKSTKRSVYKKIEDLNLEIPKSYSNIEIGEILRKDCKVGFYSDSIYRKIDPNNFNSIKEAFILDAKRNNLDISYLYNETFDIEVVDWNYGGAYGSPCISGDIRIYWEDKYDIVIYPEVDYNLKTLWHEFGHAALNLKHVCQNKDDIMYSLWGTEDYIGCENIIMEHQGFGLDEFKERARRMFQNVDQISYSCGFATQKNNIRPVP